MSSGTFPIVGLSMLKDLTVVVRVDGQKKRLELGPELDRKLNYSADMLPRFAKPDDSP